MSEADLIKPGTPIPESLEVKNQRLADLARYVVWVFPGLFGETKQGAWITPDGMDDFIQNLNEEFTQPSGPELLNHMVHRIIEVCEDRLYLPDFEDLDEETTVAWASLMPNLADDLPKRLVDASDLAVGQALLVLDALFWGDISKARLHALMAQQIARLVSEFMGHYGFIILACYVSVVLHGNLPKVIYS